MSSTSPFGNISSLNVPDTATGFGAGMSIATPKDVARASGLAPGQTAVTSGSAITPAVTGVLNASKPTAVVSSGDASKNYDNIVADNQTNATSIDVQRANLQAQIAQKQTELAAAKLAEAGKTPPPAKTPEGMIADDPGQGNQWTYDLKNGERGDPIVRGQTPPAGFTTTDVANAPGINTVSTGKGEIKDLGNGEYGLYDNNHKYVGAASASDYNAAKGSEKAQNDLVAIQNGSYPLSSGQQSQIEDIKNYYGKLIEAQKVENANVQGNMAGLQNLFGMGGSSVSASEIQRVITEGAAKIAVINKEMNDKVYAMTRAIQSDQISLVLSLKAGFDKNNSDKNQIIDDMHTQAINAVKKQTADQTTLNNQMFKLYGGSTSTPITPNMSNDELQAALQTSDKWKQDQSAKAVLTNDENAYFSDMLTSGFSMSKILPNLGYGTAGTNAKMAVLKPMIEKAKQAGISGAEFGAAMIDKTSKATAFSKLETKQQLIAANENGVVNDFDNVLLPAAKKISAAQWQTISPKLNEWLQTEVLATTGDQDLNNFLSSLTTTLTKYSNVVAGNIGSAGATQQMNTEIQGVLRRGLSYDAIKSYVDTVAKPEMRNTVTGFDTAKQSLKDGLNQLDGTFSTGNSTGGSSASGGKVQTNPDGTLQSVSF